jgi:hypothetical protein
LSAEVNALGGHHGITVTMGRRKQGDGKATARRRQGDLTRVLTQVWPYHTVGYGPTWSWEMLEQHAAAGSPEAERC